MKGGNANALKAKKHQGKQTRRQDVLNSSKYGETCEHETNSGQDNPEVSSEGHPPGDINQVVRNGIQMVQTKVD